ncbi:MAG: hypothetical protein H3C47_01760 [Candidatus Cloacimonetes bacterium]|nr:hypothetical protein [Candidatus Cloacimonadota bacterium]
MDIQPFLEVLDLFVTEVLIAGRKVDEFVKLLRSRHLEDSEIEETLLMLQNLLTQGSWPETYSAKESLRSLSLEEEGLVGSDTARNLIRLQVCGLVSPILVDALLQAFSDVATQLHEPEDFLSMVMELHPEIYDYLILMDPETVPYGGLH